MKPSSSCFLLGLIVILVSTFPAEAVEVLEPEEAFQATATVVNPKTIEIHYQIAPKTYLYRDKLQFQSEPPGLVAAPTLPSGETTMDDILGEVVVYRKSMTVQLPIQLKKITSSLNRHFTVIAQSQGCAEVGLCYPPLRHKLLINLPAAAD